jgi:hypothetical protein
VGIIESTQKDFHNTRFKMAQKFDAENWLYNTRERFDMFYLVMGYLSNL